MPLTIVAVAVGAALGALLRLALAEGFNHLAPALPAGTLIANLTGALLMGAMLAVIVTMQVPDAWRLFVTTGFLGGLTTFSTFSAEAFLLLQRGQTGAAAVHVLVHVLGSLTCTAVGFYALRSVLR